MAYDVFISHSSKDKPVADATCAFLESKGIRCWIAPRDIRPGANWGASIVKAIRGARVMVLIFSSHANASPQITREVERAINAGATVIPMRVEDVLPEDDLDYFLGTPHWLDAFTPPLEQHLQRLASVIHEILEINPPQTSVPQDAPEPAAEPATKPKTQRILEVMPEAKQIKELQPVAAPQEQEEAGDWNQIPQSTWEKSQKENEKPEHSGAGKWIGWGIVGGVFVLAIALWIAITMYRKSSSASVTVTVSEPSAPATNILPVIPAPPPPANMPTAAPISSIEASVSTDSPEAAGYRVKAEDGDVASAFKLGNLYFHGQGVPKDYAEALKWIKMAAEQGNDDAQNFLGYMYQHGDGVVQDYGLALKWFKMAANQGNLESEECLGNMYLSGQLGVAQDYSQALSWYQKAADQGDDVAKLELGCMYQNGWGVKVDYRQAFNWYQDAAVEGNFNGEYHLGTMYEDGYGVSKDATTALDWYKKAAAGGDPDAQAALKRLGF